MAPRLLWAWCTGVLACTTLEQAELPDASTQQAGATGTAGAGGATDTGAMPGSGGGSSDEGDDAPQTGETTEDSGSGTSARTCGDGIGTDPEECDGDDLRGWACADVKGFATGTLVCAADCTFDATGCLAPGPPAAGDVIVSEIMNDPVVVFDEQGEWFELYNAGDVATDLGGCRIEGDNALDLIAIGGSLVIEAGEFATFAVADQPGFDADFPYPFATFNLSNAGSDEVILLCDDTEIDRVNYDTTAQFPDATGASMTLDPRSLNATDNDLGTNWCQSTSSYNGDFGTPGTANDLCP